MVVKETGEQRIASCILKTEKPFLPTKYAVSLLRLNAFTDTPAGLTGRLINAIRLSRLALTLRHMSYTPILSQFVDGLGYHSQTCASSSSFGGFHSELPL